MNTTKETLLEEVRQAPDAMLNEVLDFVRFLKSGRFASASNGSLTTEEPVETIFDAPRTFHDLATEQRAFIASIPSPLVDIDLPDKE